MKNNLSRSAFATSLTTLLLLFVPIIFKREHWVLESYYYTFRSSDTYNFFCGGYSAIGEGALQFVCWATIIFAILGIIGWLLACTKESKSNLVICTIISSVLFFAAAIIVLADGVIEFPKGHWAFELEWGFYIAALFELASAGTAIAYLKQYNDESAS